MAGGLAKRRAQTYPGAVATMVYRIDAGDRIEFVNAAWTEQTEGAPPGAEQVLGRTLWDCFSDATLTALYRQLVKQARSGQRVRVPYRCDTATRRRWFEMEVVATSAGRVEFVSMLVREEARPPVALLQSGKARDERFVRMCSWCQRVHVPERGWQPIEQAAAALDLLEGEWMPRITHGICETCSAEMMQRLAEA